MRLRSILAAGAASISMAVTLATPAHAQSTGSIEVDKEIVVTAAKSGTTKGVEGVVTPSGSKSRQVLTQEFISNQRAGQSINDIINMVPGVSFQNNDPYGGSGGTMSIRGFDSSRISQTFDGIPLNDTGNYALYSQQQLDPELIDQVNVNLGTTDVDSPTAAASGSTVNYRTRNPTDDFHARLQGSIGEYGFFRYFGVIDTGIFTSFGTKAWIAMSHAQNYNPYQHSSATSKFQYNAKIYQPIGSNGDFISIAGHWNRGRNNNFSSVPLRTDTVQSALNPAARVVGSGSGNRFPLNAGEANYNIGACTVAAANAGVADTPNTCGTLFDQNFNPSDTGNIRINSRFTLADHLILTIDPSFQYVKANGGTGAVKGNEGFYTKAPSGTNPGTVPIFGYIGGQPYFGGVDLNGDGDVLDTSTYASNKALSNTARGVEVYAPSETRTRRWGVIANLIWNPVPGQTLRLNYSHDYGNHKQTGEVTALRIDGKTGSFFPIDNPILDATGKPMQKRNRQSFAILDQVAGEYVGKFFDNALTINAGVRSPWFTRKLNNYCVTEAGGTFVDCFNDPASQAAFLAANPTYIPPTSRTIKFHKLLPTAGINYDVNAHASIYASYTKGLQVPGTDNLYQSLGYAAGAAQPVPETTDNFDLGLRFRSGKIQAQLAGWYTVFKNRLASSYDPVNDITIYRNLGLVHKYGIDGSVMYAPTESISLYAFGSVLKSKILNNVQAGICSTAQVTDGASTGIGTCTAAGQPIYALTAGKREAGSPTYMVGGRAEGRYGPVQLGIQIKRTGSRYVNDQNTPIYQCATATSNNSLSNGTCLKANTLYKVYGSKASGYTTVDLDAKVKLGFVGLNDTTFLQINVTNLFNEFYVAGFTGNSANTAIPFAYIGAPRTVSGTFSMGF
jgi:iron complex outermembrane receptor protein